MWEWLVENWGRLIALVNFYYEKLVAWALHTWSEVTNLVGGAITWAAGQISWALSTARAFASGLFSSVWQFATSVWTWAQALFRSAWDWAIQQATNALNAARAFASGLFNSVWQFAVSVWDRALALFRSAWDWAIQQAANALNTAKALITAGLNALAQLVAQLAASIPTLIAQAIAGWLSFAQTWLPAVIGFFTNLASAVWAVIEAHLWGMLEWWLAMQLWPPGRPLPRRPDLGGSTPFPGPLPPPGPGTPGKDFLWPTNERRVSGNTFNSVHQGVDLAAATGTPIVAVQKGTIILVKAAATGYGNQIDMTHPDGWASRYGHLQSFAVAVGQSVERGQVIGLANNTGNSFGSHLHLEISKDGVRVDPLTVLT